MKRKTVMAAYAAAMAAIRRHTGLGFRAAVRRTVGTSDWRHDPERVAAAEAKRARKRARNLELQRSGSLR